MRQSNLVICAVLLAVFTSKSALSVRAHADEKSAKKDAEKKSEPTPKLSDKELMKQWADLVARREKIMKSVDEIRSEFEAAKNTTERQKVEAKMVGLRHEFETEIQPRLLTLGPLVFQKKPTDPLAAQVAIGTLLEDGRFAEIVSILKNMAKGNPESRLLAENVLQLLYRENRFAEVASVADLMADAQDADSRVLMLDSLAHFNCHEFDKAKELATRAARDPAAAKGAEKVIADCDTLAELWTKESAIRAQEAKVDDLPRVLLKTNRGDIVLELFENEAPNTVANFISLVDAKKYDGVKFHRVIPGFMAQGGDPNTLDDDPRNDGLGGPGYTIPCECYSDKARMHFQGSLSMAHAGKDTGGSQFFLTFVPTADLNWNPEKKESNHTVFGRIVKGLDVALALKIGDEMQSAKVLRKRDHAYVPKKKKDKASR
ncbi:MAG TPA: peptidylprolyl isomerase [Planctomycetaceae bacterium]|jgi:cyclophilin family peptidyl-prolyl cis-trans isomerase